MIYFLRHVETGLIKIGKADYPANRIRQHELTYGDFDVLGYLRGGHEVETPLLSVFAPFQNTELLGGVEFFNPHPSLMSYIDSVALDSVPIQGKLSIEFPNVPKIDGSPFIYVVRIGEFMESALEQYGFSKSKLAFLIGCTPTDVNRWIKKGRDSRAFSVKTVEGISKAFDIPYWALYSESVDSEEEVKEFSKRYLA